MSKMMVGLVALFLSITPLAGQSPPASASGSGAAVATSSQDEQDMEKAVFKQRGKLPENPRAKTQDNNENSACPGAAGNPCALLGGRRYYPDQWHITEHEKTWWEAFKTPGMLFSASTLFASTVIDIEGTQHCLAAGTCREVNPIMGNSRAQQYGVAMPMDALLTWLAVREKQHGRGVFPFMVMWGVSSMHLYYGVNGLRPQGHP